MPSPTGRLYVTFIVETASLNNISHLLHKKPCFHLSLEGKLFIFIKFTSLYSVDNLISSMNFHLLCGINIADVVTLLVTRGP
jgi:hypothetical protein